MTNGICKLTGRYGSFVKAHLIPKALTLGAVRGRHFIQFGAGATQVRRWTSWYDNRLVIRAGEDVLEALDTWAIPQLRKNQLVWSGWPATGAIAWEPHFSLDGLGIRIIEGIDPRRLRLFFLSLLWRAAATDRSEFANVNLPGSDLETLRLMLLAGDPGCLAFYPVQLIQLSTIGDVHNQAASALVKTIPANGDRPDFRAPIFRFYFQGLIAHVHRQASDEDIAGLNLGTLGPLMVGGSDKLAVITVTYEQSFQQTALNEARRKIAG